MLQGPHGNIIDRCDAAIALSFESVPFLRGGGEFSFEENLQIPLRLALITPLMPSLVQFSECGEALRIHPAVASILDDMRFLLGAVLAQSENPSAKDLTKVHITLAWIYDRIASLPAEGPMKRRLSSVASPTPSSAAESSTNIDVRGTPELGEDLPLPPRSRQGTSRSRSRGNRSHGPGSSRASLQAQAEVQDTWDESESASAGRPSPPPVEAPDYVYQAVRLTALAYCQAIKLRRPFSRVVSSNDFMQLWTTVWRVPLSKWRSILGVFNWILLPLLPSSKRPHDRFVKAMLNATFFQMGMEDWEIASGAMNAALKLQHWLGSGIGDQSGGAEGQTVLGQPGFGDGREGADPRESVGVGGSSRDKGKGRDV